MEQSLFDIVCGGIWEYLKKRNVAIEEYECPDNFVRRRMQRPKQAEWRERHGYEHTYEQHQHCVNNYYCESHKYAAIDAIRWMLFGPRAAITDMWLQKQLKIQNGWYNTEEAARKWQKQKMIIKKYHRKLHGNFW